MAYAVGMYFDPETDNAIRGVWQVLAESGISRSMIDSDSRPHLSLTAYEELDVAAFLPRVELLASDTVPFDVSFQPAGCDVQVLSQSRR